MSDLERAATPPLPALPVEQRPTHDPYQVYLDSLKSPESKRTMQGALDKIARMQTGDDEATGAWQPWWLLRYEHTNKIRSDLIGEGHSPSHVNKHLIAMRQVLRTCWRMGLMTAEEYERAADVKSLPVQRLPAGRNIHRDELATMLTAAEEDGPAGVRNAAVIAVLYSTGMRRAEAADALLERYDAGERTLRIIGKRDKEREVYINPTAVPILDAWLNLLGARRGPMFRPIHKTGKISDGPMTPRAIGYIVDKIRRKAGLPPLATHDFRRTHTGDLLDAGVDLATAQKLLGHASPTTTAAYDRRPGRRARAAADLLTLPGRDAEPLPRQDEAVDPHNLTVAELADVIDVAMRTTDPKYPGGLSLLSDAALTVGLQRPKVHAAWVDFAAARKRHTQAPAEETWASVQAAGRALAEELRGEREAGGA